MDAGVWFLHAHQVLEAEQPRAPREPAPTPASDLLPQTERLKADDPARAPASRRRKAARTP